jgi:hypothetical protein
MAILESASYSTTGMKIASSLLHGLANVYVVTLELNLSIAVIFNYQYHI